MGFQDFMPFWSAGFSWPSRDVPWCRCGSGWSYSHVSPPMIPVTTRLLRLLHFSQPQASLATGVHCGIPTVRPFLGAWIDPETADFQPAIEVRDPTFSRNSLGKLQVSGQGLLGSVGLVSLLFSTDLHVLVCYIIPFFFQTFRDRLNHQPAKHQQTPDWTPHFTNGGRSSSALLF